MQVAGLEPDTLGLSGDRVADVDLYGAVKLWPYEHYAAWAEADPFYILSNGHRQVVCARYEDTRTVLQDYARFTSTKQPYPGTQGFYFFNSMPTGTDSDPPEHSRRRRLMAPAFSPRALKALEAKIIKTVDDVLDAAQAKGAAIDAVDDIGTPIAVRTLLGHVCNLDEQDWSIFTGLVDAQRAAFNVLSGDTNAKQAYEAAWETTRAFCDRIIADRRVHPREDDLVTTLVNSHDVDGKITTEEMFATLFILYAAGIGGLTVFPAWTLWRLGRHHDQMALLRANPDLLEGAMSESLRTDPSSYASIRYAVEDCTISGIDVQKGMPVHTLSASGNFDATRFPDPLKWDITRGTDWRALTSFGHGVHQCIGNGLVRMTTRITLAKTLERFPNLRLADPDFRPEVVGVLKQRAPKSIPLLVD